MGERFLGWWISKAVPSNARPSTDTFSGMRILGRSLGFEVGSLEVGRAKGAIVKIFGYFVC